jgi:TonB family protein
MKKYWNELFAVMSGLMLVAGIFLINSEAKTLTEQSTQPEVVKAVAPPFIPFIFGKTGSATVVVEVTVDPEGKVIEAHTVEASLFRDKAFEETAKKWVFAPAAEGKKERTVRLTFVLRIMPKTTRWDELTTIFTTPYQVEVRHEVFDPPTNSDPNPTKPMS